MVYPIYLFMSLHCDNKPTNFASRHALCLESHDTELKMLSPTCNFAPLLTSFSL